MITNQPKEFTVGSLFSGIGGLDLGLERAGMRVAWQCEIDEFCRRVLRKHWPDVPCFNDVRDVDGTAARVDLVCGGFPCQPVSLAGKRLAQEDPRWLWPEFARVVGDLRPRYVLVENVPGLASKGLRDVVADLSALGYDAEWDVVSAASVGAPHLRERLVIVAYPGGFGLDGWSCLEGARGQEAQRSEAGDHAGDSGGVRAAGALAGADSEGQLQQGGPVFAERGRPGDGGSEGGAAVAYADGFGCEWRPRIFWQARGTEPAYRGPSAGEWWATEPNVGRVAHGIPKRMDRLRALGNAVVPQVAEFVGRLIVEADTNHRKGTT